MKISTKENENMLHHTIAFVQVGQAGLGPKLNVAQSTKWTERTEIGSTFKWENKCRPFHTPF